MATRESKNLQNQIILLMDHMGYTHNVIARELAIPPMWVRNIVFHHKEKLERRKAHEKRVAESRRRKLTLTRNEACSNLEGTL